jgi:hypothetical protein
MSTTFAFVTVAWIFFRADGIKFALGYIKQIGVSIIEHPGQFLILPGRNKMAFVYVIFLVLGDWYLRRDERSFKTSSNTIIRKFIYWIIIIIILSLIGGKQSFIYFQF